MLGDEHGELHTIAASDENTRLLELFAIQHDQGPCVDTFRSGVQRANIDLTDPKATAAFPHFAQQARKNGFAVTHALPLRLRTRVVGAMNLFHTQPGTLTAEDTALAQALADVATIAILQQRTLEQTYVERDQLQAALDQPDRHRTGQGHPRRTMEHRARRGLHRFRAYARCHGLRISDLARQIIDSLPPSACHAADRHPNGPPASVVPHYETPPSAVSHHGAPAVRSRAIWPLQRPTSNCSNCPLRLRRSTVNMAGRALSGSLLPLYGGWAGEHRGSYQSAPPRLPDPEPVRPQGPAGAAAPTSCGPASRVLRGRIPGFSRNPTLPLRTRAWATTRGSLASHARPGAAVTERRRP